jgi:lipoyl(octanoyl) transferase
VQVINLLNDGPVPYRDAWERQREMVLQRQQGMIPDTLLLLEHKPTVTYGKAADPAHRLLTPPEYARRGIELIETDRGGDVTYHGPGQLVGYPVLHLGEGSRDIHRYVRTLEAVIIGACGELGIRSAARAPWHAGVWIGDSYLAALGVKVSHWVTHHGFALNTAEEVRAGFETIVPCGVAGKRITTVSEAVGRPVSAAEVAQIVGRLFPAFFPD